MKNKKNVIIVSMLVLVAVMVIGYSYFATRLNINATGNITTNWNVYFSNITNGTVVGTASNNKTPSVTATSATMDVNLQLPGDSMTYELTLTNGGTIGAIIEDIKAEAKGSSAIIYSISGIKIGDKLASGANKTITIKIEYDPNTTSQPALTNKTLTVTIDAVQDIGQSITESNVVIEGEYGTLARTIINTNRVQSDSAIDFSKASNAIESYSEYHSDVVNYSILLNANINNNQYYFGSGYTFDKNTGKYTLTGTLKGYLREIDTEKYLYTCLRTYEGPCYEMYKFGIYNNSDVLYVYGNIINYSNTNGNGLFYTNKNTEDNKSTYYFRGTVENNYVSFGTYAEPVVYGLRYNGQGYKLSAYNSLSICNSASNDFCYTIKNVGDPIIWRIVRINEDGSIRLIVDDAVSTASYNNPETDNAYAGYMYGEIGASGDNAYKLAHANTNNSDLKEAIDLWYVNNLSSHSSLLSDTGFCNDRSIAKSPNSWASDDTALGYGTNYTYYGTYNRIENLKQPQFACPNPENDLFTLKGSNKGNKALDYPVGLITADEVMYAGGVNPDIFSNSINLDYWYGNEYILNNEYMKNTFLGSADWWTMSPKMLNAGPNEYLIRIYTSSVNYENDYAYLENLVRPVINVKGNANFTLEGTGVAGSSTNPYIIKTN